MLHRVLRGVVALAVRKLPEAVLEPVGRQILWRAGFGYSQGGVETEVRALVALLGPPLGGERYLTSELTLESGRATSLQYVRTCGFMLSSQVPARSSNSGSGFFRANPSHATKSP